MVDSQFLPPHAYLRDTVSPVTVIIFFYKIIIGVIKYL